jgi:nodulation protein E
MGSRRVVVTGLGVVSALGNDRESFWSALVSGRSGITRIQAVDLTHLNFVNGAEVRDFDATRLLTSKCIDQTDRFAQFALVAAQEAVADAGLDRAALANRRSGVVTGTGVGGQATQDAGFAAIYKDGRKRVHPNTIPKMMSNASTGQITIEYGMMGPSYTVSVACSSSNLAIGQGFWLVRGGLLDIALVGGSEAPFSYGALRAWDAMRVVSSDTCRPFSTGRDGMILGEGGGILVLEDSEHAQARGARIYAEMAGFGMSANAHHVVQPSIVGAANAMEAAIEDGQLRSTDIDYINAHGSGTLASDAAETAAIRTIFGAHADRLAVSSTKSMHGHALGAAGALEAVATVLAIDRQFVPPTANYLGLDPECDLDFVPNEARACAIRVALSNSFAFGGLNAVLALRRWRT